MNYQKAIELLHPDTSRDAIWKIADEEEAIKKIEEALLMACEAMKELQLYKDGKLCLVPEDVYARQCEELDAYKQLGDLEEVREAMEKQDPKKVEIWNGQAMCPNCRSLFGNMSDIRNLVAWDMPHCKFCGQGIDWTEVEE